MADCFSALAVVQQLQLSLYGRGIDASDVRAMVCAVQSRCGKCFLSCVSASSLVS